MENLGSGSESQESRLNVTDSVRKRLMESNIIGIVLTSLEGSIHQANPAFLNMLGYSQSDALPRWDEITPDEYGPNDAAAVQQILRTERAAHVRRYRFGAGREVPRESGAPVLAECLQRGHVFRGQQPVAIRRHIQQQIGAAAH